MILSFSPHPNANYFQDYERLVAEINELVRKDQTTKLMDVVRANAASDLFFLMHFMLRIDPVNQPWLVDRIREVQDRTHMVMDLWFREGWKSTIKTYAENIRRIINNPEITIGIFSHTRQIAKSFLRSIKHTCETSDNLRFFFPDIFWMKPDSEAPKWSEDEGLFLKRKGIYKEGTVEAWGLIDGMPTGRHFSHLDYDDVITEKSVTTPEMLEKVDEAFKLSDNLGQRGGTKTITGTHYHFNDTYMRIRKNPDWTARIYPATVDGTVSGESVFLTREELDKKLRKQGIYVFSCQMLLNPVPEERQKFRREWVIYYEVLPRNLSLFLVVDPASGKKEKETKHDYTVMWVVGKDERGNRFVVDGVRERLPLKMRWEWILRFLRRYRTIQKVGYEQYGMVSDIQYFHEMMGKTGEYFQIEELKGNVRKFDRIMRLQPLFENGQVFFPETLMSNKRDLTREFVEEEYLTFPSAAHDDMLDCLARVEDEDFRAYPPMAYPAEDDEGEESDGVVDMGWYRAKKESRYANI